MMTTLQYILNPVKDILQVVSENFAGKIEIVAIQSHILLSKINNNKFDLSGLQSGNYIIKNYFNNIVSSSKIIKE